VLLIYRGCPGAHALPAKLIYIQQLDYVRGDPCVGRVRHYTCESFLGQFKIVFCVYLRFSPRTIRPACEGSVLNEVADCWLVHIFDHCVPELRCTADCQLGDHARVGIRLTRSVHWIQLVDLTLGIRGVLDVQCKNQPAVLTLSISCCFALVITPPSTVAF